MLKKLVARIKVLVLMNREMTKHIHRNEDRDVLVSTSNGGRRRIRTRHISFVTKLSHFESIGNIYAIDFVLGFNGAYSYGVVSGAIVPTKDLLSYSCTSDEIDLAIEAYGPTIMLMPRGN